MEANFLHHMEEAQFFELLKKKQTYKICNTIQYRLIKKKYSLTYAEV